MFRKLSSALYQATHLQLLSTLRNTKNACLKNKIDNFKNSIVENLKRYETPVRTTADKKITIVGKKESSLEMALNCLARDVCNQICIMDYQGNSSSCPKANSNLKSDEENSKSNSKFLLNNKLPIKATKHFPDTKNSDLIILTKDIKDDKHRLKSFHDSVEQFTNVMNNLIPNLIKYSPNTIFLIDTDQADVASYVAWKISRLPKNRVLCTNQINEFFKDAIPCTADVAAKIIENYQCIVLSTLAPAEQVPPVVVKIKENQAENENFAQTLTSALCKTMTNSNFKNNLNNFLNKDLMYKQNIILQKALLRYASKLFTLGNELFTSCLHCIHT